MGGANDGKIRANEKQGAATMAVKKKSCMGKRPLYGGRKGCIVAGIA